MTKVVEVKQFCSDENCEFWDDYPDGQMTKLGRMCPCCGTALVLQDPKNSRLTITIRMLDTQLEAEYPNTESLPPGSVENFDKFQNKKKTENLVARKVDQGSAVIPSEPNINEGITSPGQNNTNQNTSRKAHEYQATKTQQRLNTLENTISSAIFPSSFSTDSPNCPSGSREQTSSNLNYQCAHSQSSNLINKVGNRDQAIKQSLPPFLTILTVMDPDETNHFSIRFYTLILDEFWKNIDAICLRIGTEYFNTFRTSIVPFRKATLVNLQLGKFVLINGTLQLPISLIRNSSINFAYKYYIYFKNGKEDFESLYHPHEEVNRYFSLALHNTRKAELRGCIHKQYDLMILPDLRKHGNPSFWTQIKSTVSFFASTTGNVPFHDINERRLISFQVLLPYYYKLGYLESCKILQDFITRFNTEVTELSYLLIQDLNGSAKHHYWENNSKDNIFKLVEAWIKTTFIPQDNPIHPKAIIHHFYLACYLIQYYKLTNEDLFVKCIKMVEDSVEDILKTKSYLIDDSVCKTDKFRKEIYNSVLNFIFSKVVRSKYPEKLLLLIPIYHGICTPAKDYHKMHENLEYSLNEFWGFAQEETLHSSCELTFNSFKRVFDLMKYDKLLPYSLVIYTLNDKNANLICEHFVSDPKNCPISAIMGVLLNRLFCSSKKKKGSILKYDEKLITEVLRTLNGAFMPENNKFLILDINRLIALTIVLTNSLIPELVTADQFHQCLKLLCQGVNYCATNCPYSIPQIDSGHLFHNFILKRHSIRIFKNRMYYGDYLDEIKFWGEIILNYPFPSSITLHKLIEDCLTMRFRDQNITQQYIIDLFIHLHNSNNHSLLLQDIFRKELTARLQGMKSEDKSLYVRQLLKGLRDPGQLAKLNKIFNKILLDEEQEFENNTTHHLISWTSWNTYFSLLNFDNIDQIISHDAKEMLDTAVIQFCSIISQINDFSLTGEELNLIRNNTEHFLTLLEIIFKTKKNPANIPLDDIKQKLYQCFEMYEWVRNKTNILFSLNTFLENLHNLNYKLVSDFLCSNIEKEKLNIICQSEATSYKFAYSSLINEIIWFPEINRISNYCNSFSKSRLLLKVFNDMIIEKGIKFETQFDIKVFYENIWIPSMNFCIEFLQRLTSQTILISEMCKYFTPGEEMHSILSELNTLHIACRQYNNEIPETSNLLLPCAQRMQLYSSLQLCSEAAILITKLKNGLLIKSNFEIIESLKNTFKSKQLNQVNAQVSHTATYLGKLSKSNLDVIQAIIDRIEFIMWIRSNLKDLNELKTFVDISLTTCGGNPVDVDRITCLSSICTNFAPIIFQIDENTSYEILIARCRQVIESVERNKELTKLLRQVGENVRFWEEMKKSHGSVEETTLMQLDSIIKSGVFQLKIGESLNLCDIVSLSVVRENGEKRIYSLEQLKEFRSKLMLVVGKSELPGVDTHTSSYENSQLFNHKLDTITEIGTIVIQLAETGNQRYLKYELFSDCNQQEDGLLETKMKLRNTLEDWKVNVEEARNTHYFLNYYTISQIVFLQKGIRSFIENREDRELEQLYHLLRLLNPDVSKQDIQQALEHFNIIPKQNPTLKTSYESTHDFSKQSLSTAISTHYSHIGPTKPKCIPTPKSFSGPIDDETEVPESLSSMEKELAQEVSVEAELPLELVIRGIIDISNNNEGLILKNKLMIWCLEHEPDSDTDSIDEVPITDSSVESFLNPPNKESTTIDAVLDLYQLGSFLEDLFQSGVTKIRAEREFPYNLESGTPNLIVIPSEGMLEFVLSLYMSDNDKLPLPYYHEIMICTPQTRLEEIEIFWRRAVMIPDKFNHYLFCLVGIENLSYDVAVQAVSKLKRLQQSKNRVTTGKEEFCYKLVLICSEEKEGFSYMAAAFDDCKVPILSIQKSSDIKEYLCQKLSPVLRRAIFKCTEPAWMVDKAKSRVRLVVSDSVGAGKSLYINNLKSELLSLGIVSEEGREQSAVTVAIHGRQASEEHLAEQLLKNSVSSVKHGVMYHVDVASTVQLSLEPILFKLLILGGICKRSGELWHSRGRDYYLIEMTLSSFQNEFYSLYPNVYSAQPSAVIHTSVTSSKHSTNIEELQTEQFQRVTSYLKQCDDCQDLDNISYNTSLGTGNYTYNEKLVTIMNHCGAIQPSWTEMCNFVSFLDKQLSDCDNSDYCKSGIMGEEWKGFRHFVVRFLILMSRDFAAPFCVQDRNLNTNDVYKKYQFLDKRSWESNSYPYIFFNSDRQTMTLLGFRISNTGHLIGSENPSNIIKHNIMRPKLYKLLMANGVDLQENFNQLTKIQKIMKIANVMRIECSSDPDPSYVLTLDNMRKILAILMRFRCNIPVVIMGETGCGKTRLIQFMCSLQALQTGATNMLILKVHGGTTESDVMCKVEEAEKLAQRNYLEYQIDTVMFLDEANTSPAIGLIKEIMCDRRMYGRHIRTDIGLQFIAACNPYRKHTEEMLNKLSSAGLGFFTKSSETTDKLGDIPLRELVYRVMELPASLRPLVWDFGQLSNSIEKTYTREIVSRHLRDRNSPIKARDDIIDVISDVLAGAQNYMRERKDECSFVSLRDVERAMRVMLWFYSKIDYFRPEQDTYSNESDTSSVEEGIPDDGVMSADDTDMRDTLETPEPMPMIEINIHPYIMDREDEEIVMNNLIVSAINRIDPITYSLIISLAVCYRARLQDRHEFDQQIINLFEYPLTSIDDYKIIHREVDRCQQLLLDEMTVGANIAKNTALKENVFMMFVCIELKIPLFVIGKPGSSKSLAKSIISHSMQGSRCPDGSILQNFKQVQIMSYQCSQLSTADGIIGVFNSCRNLQRKTGSNKFTACVVLDEVGLAEDSPLLPLKVLHPLLEDSSYGSEEVECTEELTGNSMQIETPTYNGVPIQLDDMKDHVAFIGISNWSLDPAKMNRGIMLSRGDPDNDELITSANGICQSTSTKGAIVKSIEKRIQSLAKAYMILTSNNINQNDCTRRDYYGLRDFYSLVKMLIFICIETKTILNRSILVHAVKRNFGGVSDVDPVEIFLNFVKLPIDNKIGPDSSPLGLISANLMNLSRSFHRETRYLLLLTENYAALNILLRSPDMWPKQQDIQSIRVIFGSSFPYDQGYSAVCRNINRIKVCMESGKTVILLNLENLYESLYDALNQYYMEMNNLRYVDLGLGMKCRVHNDFKLIVVADKETVQDRFPTPLINRLEKHILTVSTVLTEDCVKVSNYLLEWAHKFSTTDSNQYFAFQRVNQFNAGNCFIGYHSDTPSSIVFHVLKEMYPNDKTNANEVDQIALLERSQTLLLRMATTDAVLRVKNSHLSSQSEQIIAEYFKLQLGSLEEYLSRVLSGICGNETGVHLTLATTHSRLLTERDIDQLQQRLSTDTDSVQIRSLSLQQFQTEQQYIREIHKFLRGDSESETRETTYKRILLVQCKRGAENAKLIACARHKTVDELKDWREEQRGEFKCDVFLLFLVQLSREAHGSKFMSFCGGDWNTVHIDDIRSLDYAELPPISQLIGKQIYEVFGNIDLVSVIPYIL